MINKCIELLKNLIHKIWFRIKLWKMDDWWYYTGGSCFGLFPPSFYFTHSEEEIDRIMEETCTRIQALIDELDPASPNSRTADVRKMEDKNV